MRLDEDITIARLVDPGEVEPMLDSYVRWCLERLATVNGVTFDDPEAVVALYRGSFRTDLPHLCSARGRLLVARLHGRACGVGALKPIDAETAEIKRLYVAPEHRRRGIARRMLERLIDDARAEGYRAIRLETGNFMTDAHRLYRSLGFEDIAAFDDRETAKSDGLEQYLYFMRLRLSDTPAPRPIRRTPGPQ